VSRVSRAMIGCQRAVDVSDLVSVSGSNRNIAFLRKLEDGRKNHISEACKSFILGQTFQHAI